MNIIPKTNMLLILVLVGSTTALYMPNFYHQSLDINIEIEQLQRHCETLTIQPSTMDQKISILHVNKDKNMPNKAFILFGEHARELISPETGLRFLQKLCKGSEEVKPVLENYELRMIVNLNQKSRQKVEQGDFCLRENERGVDLNRNYKAHWSKEHDPQTKHTDPGPFPFSEIETQVVRDELREFKPNAFLSIHSGTLGLFSPYAYAKEQPANNIDNMMDILKEIKEKHCDQCKMGACGSEIGYLSAGTSMDFAYDEMQIPYSFTFEIFHQNVDLRNSKKKRNSSFLQQQNYHSKDEILEEQRVDLMLRESSCFAETQMKEMPNDECFRYFNPEEKDQYDYYIDNWSNAISLALQRVNDQRSTQRK